MDEFKGTKGPWAIGAGGGKIITNYRDESGNMTDDNWLKGGWAKSVCMVKYASWMNDEEAKHNEKLIKSAPDLLNTLIKIRDLNIKDFRDLWFSEAFVTIIGRIQKEADMAVSEVTGISYIE